MVLILNFTFSNFSTSSSTKLKWEMLRWQLAEIKMYLYFLSCNKIVYLWLSFFISVLVNYDNSFEGAFDEICYVNVQISLK